MLQSIRDRAQGWLVWTIVILISATFALWGVNRFRDSGDPELDTLAKVNGNKVNRKQRDNLFQRMRFELVGNNAAIDPKLELDLKERALRELIQSLVLADSAFKLGFRISEEQINYAITKMPALQVDGKFSKEVLLRMLMQMSMSQQEFFGSVRSSMLINQVRSSFLISSFTLPADFSQIKTLLGQTRSFKYLIIPTKSLAGHIKISDKETKAFYDAHPKQFSDPEKVKLEYVELSFANIVKTIKPTTEDVSRYYQENIQSFTTPPEWKVAHILFPVSSNTGTEGAAKAKAQADSVYEKAMQGGDFAKLAKEYSADYLSADDGGNIGWVKEGTLGPVFTQTIKEMKPGGISHPVRTKYGYDIIKLLKVKNAHVETFEKVKAAVRKALVNQQAERIFAEHAEELASLAFENPDSLQPVHEQLQLKIYTSAWVTKENATKAKDKLNQNAKVRNAAFSEDVLAGNNSSVIEFDATTQIVLRIKQHKDKAVQTFKSVKKGIVHTLQQEHAKAQSAKIGKKIIAAMKHKKLDAPVVKKYSKQWKQFNDIKRTNQDIDSEILLAAFNIPNPQAKRTHPLEGFELANGNFALIELEKVTMHTASPDVDTEKDQALVQSIELSYGQLAYDLYSKEQVKKAKIKFSKGNELNFD